MTAGESASFDNHLLRARYSEYRRGGAFASEDLLWQLGRIGWRATSQESGAAQLIAMVLAMTFCDAASRIEGRPITQESAERWFGWMDQPIWRCLDILAGHSDEKAELALTSLAAAYARVSTEISG